MKKPYVIPIMDCTPVNTRDLMQAMNGSVGDGGDQNGFLAPERMNLN